MESENHIFFQCPYAQRIWRSSGVPSNIINSNTASFAEKLEACLQFSSSTRLQHFENLPIWILWRIWKSRNMLVFQQKNIHWEKIIQQARRDTKEWRQWTMNDNITTTGNAVMERTTDIWRLPPQDWIKCNVDGSFTSQQCTSGWVIRDSNGCYKGAGQACGDRVNTAFESELQAMIMAMQHCWILGYKKIQFESDCNKMIKILNKELIHFGGYNWIREINWWKQKFQEVSFVWIGRNGNQVADSLAKNMHHQQISFIFHYYVPQFITQMLHNDHIRSSS